MAAAGFDGILIAFPIFGRDKVDRIATLARDQQFLFPLTMKGLRKGYRAPQSRRARPWAS